MVNKNIHIYWHAGIIVGQLEDGDAGDALELDHLARITNSTSDVVTLKILSVNSSNPFDIAYNSKRTWRYIPKESKPGNFKSTFSWYT